VRIRDWRTSFSVLLICMAAICSWGDQCSSPLIPHADADNEREFQNVYQCFNKSSFSNWVAYTPTILGFSTPSIIQFMWRRVGDTLFVKGIFDPGTPSGVASISLPNSLSINYGPLNNQFICGSWSNASSGATQVYALIATGSTNDIRFSEGNGTNLQSLNGFQVTEAGQYVYVQFDVPIIGWSF
jgi:hypothetical protein